MCRDVPARATGSQPVRFNRPASWGFVLVLFVLAAALRADDALNAWQAQKKNFEDVVKHMPVLDKHRVEDILRVRVENNALVVRTPLPNTVDNGFMQARLDGITGTGLVLVQRKEGDRAGDEVEPASFTLSITDYAIPRQTTSLSVTSQPNQLSVSRSVQLTDGRFNQVILTQSHGPQSNGATSLQLIVTDAKVAGAAPTQLNFDAPDFFSFLREHPQEANQYLRPLLREVGQESVFAPQAMVAWQIFSDLWAPDPQVTRKIQDLLPLLEDENYRVRNEALWKLHGLGTDGAAVMVHMDRTRLSPEQNMLIDRALVQYAQLPAREAARLRSDPAFLLDCLYSDDPTVRRAALDRLNKIAKANLPFNVNADAVSRAKAVAILRQQLLGQPRSAR